MVRYVDPEKWRGVLAVAIAAGCAVGVLDPLLRWGTSAAGLAPHLGTWISAGLLNLLALIALALWYPRRRVAMAAAMLVCGSYAASVLTIHGLILRTFALGVLARDLALVMGVGLPVCLSLIWLLMASQPSRRRVGFDPRARCEACGYLLTGLIEPRCPECGRSFDPSLVRDA